MDQSLGSRIINGERHKRYNKEIYLKQEPLMDASNRKMPPDFMND